MSYCADPRPSHRQISVVIDGSKTSISLEPEFWEAFSEIAANLGKARSTLIAEIAAQQLSSNLSSAVRIFVLRSVRAAAGVTLVAAAQPSRKRWTRRVTAGA